MSNSRHEINRLNSKNKIVTTRNEEAKLITISLEIRNQHNEYLENKVKASFELDDVLRGHIYGLESELRDYRNSANIEPCEV